MSETIDGGIFGMLEFESDDDGRVRLTGKVSIADKPSCRLHITGASGSPVEDILRTAVSAHEELTNREPELRKSAVNHVITDEWLEEAAENIGEPVSREEAIESYKNITVISYFTEVDEVSIYFEDEESIFGIDINLVSDLKFTKIKANGDG